MRAVLNRVNEEQYTSLNIKKSVLAANYHCVTDVSEFWGNLSRVTAGGERVKRVRARPRHGGLRSAHLIS